MTEKQLLDLKEDIETAKDEVNRLEGRKEHLLQELQEDWDCQTVQEAEELLEQIKGEISETEQKIKKGTAKLKEKYEFD